MKTTEYNKNIQLALLKNAIKNIYDINLKKEYLKALQLSQQKLFDNDVIENVLSDISKK